MIDLFYLIDCLQNQEYAFVLAPSNDNTQKYQTFLIVATAFKIMHVAYIIYSQSTVNIFFIDRETPGRKGKKQDTAASSNQSESRPPRKRDGSVR